MLRVLRRRELLAACLLGGAWLAFYALWLALGPGGHAQVVFGDTVYLVPIAAATVLSFVAALRGTPALRSFWSVLALSNVLWLAAEVLFAARELSTGAVPFPWWTDAGYLGSYALIPVAVYLGFRPTLRTVELPTMLEGGIVVGCLGLVWGVVLMGALPLGTDFESIVGLMYPAAVFVLLGAVVAVRLVPSRHGTVGLALVGMGAACAALGDGFYTHASLTGGYISGAWAELGWQAQALLFSLAALVSALRVDEHRDWARIRDPYRVTRALILGASLVIAGVLSYAALADAWSAGLLAGCCVVALLLGVRMVLAHARVRRLRELVDPSTGAYDRRYFYDQLARLTARGRYFGETFTLLVASPDADRDADPGERDLEIARSLVRGVRDVDVVARLAQDRIGILLPHIGAETGRVVAERLRARVATGPVPSEARPAGITISLGLGSWRLADDGRAVLARAEQSATKAGVLGGNQIRAESDPGLDADRESTFDLLLAVQEAVDVREGDDGRHSHLIGAVARELGAALGLDQDGISKAYVGGVLHDVGKVSLPDSVLLKPAPLDNHEWHLVRTHPERGAELLGRFEPTRHAAEIVAAHHERWDGGGYPRGLAGERIPPEARVVAVADALVSMVSDRTYRKALTVTAALTEIWRYAGECYDPTVVSALLALGREGRLPLEQDGKIGEPLRVAV